MIAGPLLLLALATPGGADDPFRDRVAPILESRCLSCHGGDRPEGGFSLETRSGLLAGGDIHGPAFDAEAPAFSPLLDAISGDEPRMPPEGDPLGPGEVDAIRRWVLDGAPWPAGTSLRDRRFDDDWWSLAPPARPEVPEPRDPTLVRNPIDAFILSRLDEDGLTAGPEADRRTLIRRATYDLTGLPPTPGEVDAFLDDRGPGAFERLVDRLLASPRYGERKARRWLDLVHFADTHGYDKDKRRPHAWPYRDYVIRSFNEDIPYGRFVRQQIAGDVLDPGDPDGVIATGFIAAGPWDFVGHVELREGTVDKQKTRLIDRDDMLANAMSTFVSLTVHCARCHDHKFDPIPQQDYYRLQAVFSGVERGDRPFESVEAAKRRGGLERRRAEVAARLDTLNRRIDERTRADRARIVAELASRLLEIDELPRPGLGEASPTNGYHSAIATTPDTTKWVQVDLGRAVPVSAIYLIPARPVDFPDTPGFGFPAGFRVEVSEDDPEFRHADRLVDHASGSFENPGDVPVRIAPEDGIARTARYVRVTATRLRERRDDYAFALGELLVISGGEEVAGGAAVSSLDSIEAGRWGRSHLVDGFDSRTRLADPDDPETLSAIDRRATLLQSARRDHASRWRSILASRVDPDTIAEVGKAEDELAELDRSIDALPGPSLVYAASPRAPRPIHLLARGDVTQPGEEVGPGALSRVPGPDPDFDETEDEGARRAALAEWIAHPDNPLTWRSIVNRAWQDRFGVGLVDTPSDFGRNGSTPSHPELLDWLAVEFRDSGGSLKELDRLIVTSGTYRQSSRHDAADARVDSGNRLLWRQNRRRLEAEEIRDAALFVSGALDESMGGPGFALFRFEDDHSPIYDHDDPAWIDPPEGRRRAIYRFAVRSVPDPFLECLDGADPNINVPVRNETITALQSLALLNDPFMIARAKDLAARISGMARGTGGRIDAAYRLALGRSPGEEERSALANYAGEHGLEAACRLVLNLNEFAFVD
ncbi:Planctomycete cytochrome C [Tautonia plasticadhaerens]|uniref:Planctomycete cytochrome C n=2 Tax=Tautonia plasticadhaerens TaxID=2527974 RepID=A0A518GX47_9BACT|nr:Planctomycete cytochrome C [Tautonia plasticadhaerens]